MISKEIHIHTEKDVKKDGDDYSLEIVLDGQSFQLPIINVGGENQPEYIAILDPREPGIAEAGSNVLADMLQQLGVGLIITAPSSKSEEMIQSANEKAGIKKEPIIVTGGTNEEKQILTEDEVVEIASPMGEKHWIEECRPITLGEDAPPKFFAINEADAKKIINVIQSGHKIAVVDDVYSSGATTEAIYKLINRALQAAGVKTPDVPIVVVAREALGGTEIFESQGRLKADNLALNLYASILIPVLLELPED